MLDCVCCFELVVFEDDMKWLLDLVLGELGEYYKVYEEVNGIEILENDCFFLKELIKKKVFIKKIEKICCFVVKLVLKK